MWEVQLGPHYASSQTPWLCPIHNWGPLARILISQQNFRLPQGNLTAFSYCSFSKRQENSRKTSALLITPKPLTVWITTNCGKFFKELRIPDHLTCLLRNLYAGQEGTVRTGHGTIDLFQIGKGVRQGYILPPCLFNLYVEYIM